MKKFSLSHMSKSAFIVNCNSKIISVNENADLIMDQYKLFYIDEDDKIVFFNSDINMDFKNKLKNLSNFNANETDVVADINIIYDDNNFRFSFLPMKQEYEKSNFNGVVVNRSSKEFYMVIIDIYKKKNTEENIAELLSKNYKLTRTEVKLVNYLVAGYTLLEISKLSETSIHTVRTHLKSVFFKMNIGRQQDLITIVHDLKFFFETK